ncbi:glycosyltransferase [Pseudaminobacter salicylatoxidans]|uniref:glycosyltransferase n=1 Tax=Pseudaminobacter salicylatoxidans TaxID=93369 RepID=UPI000377D71F|nr:hypothetical protein [Pseudaminobacter salicylatoxidans]
MPYPNVTDRSRFQELVDEADIIHIKDEIGFFVGNNRLDKSIFNKSGKPRIYTAYGGQMRKYQSNEAFREYVMSHDARIALTPDLNYEWFNAALVPQAIDAEKNKVLWRDGRKLMHSPSTQIRKGTPDLLKAIEGLDIDFELIHGLPYEECIARKKKANLFFDQAGREITEFLGIDTIIGWYGNAAIEAAVHGIPTIAHLSEEALDGGERAGYDNIRSKCGILNTPFGAEGIRKTISEFFFDASPSDRAEISSRTRKWVENFHSHKAVGEALSRVYNRLI